MPTVIQYNQFLVKNGYDVNLCKENPMRVGENGYDTNLSFEVIKDLAIQLKCNWIVKNGPKAKWYIKNVPDNKIRWDFVQKKMSPFCISWKIVY